MKTVLVGFDAFDPKFFEKLHIQGKTPNLSQFVETAGYSPLQVSNPPQSEVSWTSIATGLNPGGHGMFDFVHRNPETYGLFISLLPTKSSLLGTQFASPHNAETIFEAAVKDGYPATSLWWPATFPARLQSPVQTIPGLGTPDIFGQLGVGFSFSLESRTNEENRKTRCCRIQKQSKDEFLGKLEGPVQQSRSGTKKTSLDFRLSLLNNQSAKFILGNQELDLKIGEWSPIIEINFKVSLMVKVKVITRVIVTQLQPEPELYFLPLQLHPLNSPWPYATPKGMIKKIWKNQGAFLTQGWPQDTTALEEGFITDEQFLSLCDHILYQREQIFMAMLESYNEGVLGCVFDSLDRVQHMFWKNRPDIIESWYLKLDALAGRIQSKLRNKTGGDQTNLLFISDHGFQDFTYKINVNRWLIEKGFMNVKEGSKAQNLTAVDWKKTQAYAIGLNSLYLNLSGREGQGNVQPAHKRNTIDSLINELLTWKGPDGNRVFQNITKNEDAFDGPLSEYGPDLVLGFSPKYRASSETGLGGWGEKSLVKNPDHWEADHCIDANAVPGVIFRDRGLKNYPHPSYEDIPHLTIGKKISARKSKVPVGNDEDQDALEERLKGLGYL